MNILATVGMSQWPFDRLIRAITPLCSNDSYRVFAQIGPSTVIPPCPHARFVPYDELIHRIHTADLVITHAGNTVRLVQRTGKVPVVVARTAAAGEMPNDHQVEYLRHEERYGRVVAVWDLDLLERAVTEHSTLQSRLLSERPLKEPAKAACVAATLDELWESLARNPFKDHPLRRYAFAWDELHARSGCHLDIGCGTGEFLGVLAATTGLECYGVDPHEGYLRQLSARHPQLPVQHISIHGPLPFPEASFDSISMLDVLEHCADECGMLREVRRVLKPGGLLVLTVPARHPFSWLDPDNVKFRLPRLHRAVYSIRFGSEVYRERFVDLSNGLCGDMSVGKREHTNYRRDGLAQQLRAHGLEIVRESGANLFWRWFQIPALLGGQRVRRCMEQAIRLDGELFHRANLFLSARRVA